MANAIADRQLLQHEPSTKLSYLHCMNTNENNPVEPQDPQGKKDPKREKATMTIALGVAIGAALGVALHNIPMGVALGAAIGAGLSVAQQRRGG